MERTHGYSTLRSMDHTINSQDQVLRYLSPTLQKRRQIDLSADQLQRLETMFQEDPCPDMIKKRVIAASFGVRPKDIKAWFHYRKWKERKKRPVTANVGHGQSTAGYTPHHQISPTLPTLPHSSLGAPPLFQYYATKPPLFAPSSSTVSIQMAPSHSSLLSSVSSPGQSREWDTGQHQLSSQWGLVLFPPHPMHNSPPLLPSPLLPPLLQRPPLLPPPLQCPPLLPPPLQCPPLLPSPLQRPPLLPPPLLRPPLLPSPLQRPPLLPLPLLPAPLPPLPLLPSPLPPPPFTMTYNSADLTPPLLNTPPYFLDSLATLAHDETQSLPTDTSSLFDLDYLMSSQLQSSYPTSQPQLQPDTSLPSMPYLTPSPYLTPNPPDLNPTSYLTLGPEGNSSGVVTTSTSDPTCFQSQSTGQILLRSSDQDAGSAAYQPSPQGQPEQSASHAPM